MVRVELGDRLIRQQCGAADRQRSREQNACELTSRQRIDDSMPQMQRVGVAQRCVDGRCSLGVVRTPSFYMREAAERDEVFRPCSLRVRPS